MIDISFPAETSKSARPFDPRNTFSEFVVGTGNQFAHAASIAAAGQPGDTYNPLFIYGGVGLGKTHLASAIGHRLQSDGEGLRRVIFMSAESFTNELISSLKANRMGEFQAKFRGADALLLDDVEFLAGSERTQEELFHTFDSLHSAHHQIVLTSDKIPRDIPGLEDRLRNRFECGLTADIAAPDLETRIAILEKKAAYDDLLLPSEVAQYVAKYIFSNVRELEGCLNRLVALSSLNHCMITLPFARDALRLARSDTGCEWQGRHRSHSKGGRGLFPCAPYRSHVETTYPASGVVPPGRDVPLPRIDRRLLPGYWREFRTRSLDRDPRS